jgi:hypothetical protein
MTVRASDPASPTILASASRLTSRQVNANVSRSSPVKLTSLDADDDTLTLADASDTSC